MTITKIKKEYNKFNVKMVLSQGKIEMLIRILRMQGTHPLAEELHNEFSRAWDGVPAGQKLL